MVIIHQNQLYKLVILGWGGLQVIDFHKECYFPLYKISLSKIVLI